MSKTGTFRAHLPPGVVLALLGVVVAGVIVIVVEIRTSTTMLSALLAAAVVGATFNPSALRWRLTKKDGGRPPSKRSVIGAGEMGWRFSDRPSRQRPSTKTCPEMSVEENQGLLDRSTRRSTAARKRPIPLERPTDANEQLRESWPTVGRARW